MKIKICTLKNCHERFKQWQSFTHKWQWNNFIRSLSRRLSKCISFLRTIKLLVELFNNVPGVAQIKNSYLPPLNVVRGDANPLATVAAARHKTALAIFIVLIQKCCGTTRARTCRELGLRRKMNIHWKRTWNLIRSSWRWKTYTTNDTHKAPKELLTVQRYRTKLIWRGVQLSKLRLRIWHTIDIWIFYVSNFFVLHRI